MGQYAIWQSQVLEATQTLVRQGFLMATGGNVSVRVAGEAAFAVTPSNFDYDRMQPEDVCIVGLDGKIIEARHKPSIESGLHASIYTVRADVQAVVHTHQVFASALTLIDAPIPALFDEQARFLGRSVPIIPYAPSGTGWLRKAIAKHVRDGNNAYLMKNHGALCLGHSLERAVHNVEILEKCAQAYLLALCTERPVSRIPLAVREIAVAKLRGDQRRAARGELPQGGE
jgi:ribulose-5-phosphate 4-epimerase/fuculose-1-phosphate aldolase